MSQKTYERPSFFKVLVNDDFSNRLRIPPQFLKHVGNSPHNKFLLWNHERRNWHVFAEKVQETMWFKKGWEDFVRDNALKFGDFVVFFYTGNSNFDVIAYGRNCCGKISATANTISQPQVIEKSAGEADPFNNGVEIMDIASDDSDEEEARFHHSRNHLYQNSNGGKSNPEEAASKSLWSNPHFRVVIHQSYFDKYLNIPREFWLRHIDEKSDNIMLRVSDKSWLVKLNRVGRALRLTKGWQAFVKDNCIQIGDACIFEMIEEALHVTVCRA